MPIAIGINDDLEREGSEYKSFPQYARVVYMILKME